MTGEAAAPDHTVSGSAHSFVAQMLADDRSAERLGIVGSDAGQGRSTAQLTVEPDMVNGLGIAHGGFVFALADGAFACAANSLIQGVATKDAQISFLAPARLGDRLVAEAAVTLAAGRRVIVDVTVRVEGRTIALFRGTGRIMAPRT